MEYVLPDEVRSPLGMISDFKVLRHGQSNDYALAKFRWGDNENFAVGIRWNGDSGSPLGVPQSRGNATWFILPDSLADFILEMFEKV